MFVFLCNNAEPIVGPGEWTIEDERTDKDQPLLFNCEDILIAFLDPELKLNPRPVEVRPPPKALRTNRESSKSVRSTSQASSGHGSSSTPSSRSDTLHKDKSLPKIMSPAAKAKN